MRQPLQTSPSWRLKMWPPQPKAYEVVSPAELESEAYKAASLAQLQPEADKTASPAENKH